MHEQIRSPSKTKNFHARTASFENLWNPICLSAKSQPGQPKTTEIFEAEPFAGGRRTSLFIKCPDSEFSNATAVVRGKAEGVLDFLADLLLRCGIAGVVLLDLAHLQERPADIFPSIDVERRARLMSALDSVNMRYGRRTLAPACAGKQQGWSMKRQKLSPRYTTVFDEVMLASAR